MKTKTVKLFAYLVLYMSMTILTLSCGSACYECKAGGEAMSISKTFCENEFDNKDQFEKTVDAAKKSGAKCEKK